MHCFLGARIRGWCRLTASPTVKNDHIRPTARNVVRWNPTTSHESGDRVKVPNPKVLRITCRRDFERVCLAHGVVEETDGCALTTAILPSYQVTERRAPCTHRQLPLACTRIEGPETMLVELSAPVPVLPALGRSHSRFRLLSHRSLPQPHRFAVSCLRNGFRRQDNVPVSEKIPEKQEPGIRARWVGRCWNGRRRKSG